MFYLSTDEVVIKSVYPKFIITKEEDKPAMASIDTNAKIVTLNIHENSLYADFADYFMCKGQDVASKPITLNTGIYELLLPICINGFTFARSVKTLDKTFNQFLLDPNLEKNNTIVLKHDSINIVINVGMCTDSYVDFINDSGLFYVLTVDKPIITTSYGIILNRAREINVRSPAIQIISNQPILIEEADYISALILKLLNQIDFVLLLSKISITSSSSKTGCFSF